MKKFLPLIAILLLGCASFNNTAGKLLVSAAMTVDASMKGWASYVVAGGSTPEQENEVKTLYKKYQAAMSVAQTAYVAAASGGDKTVWNNASAALTASSGALSSLVQTFMMKGKS